MLLVFVAVRDGFGSGVPVATAVAVRVDTEAVPVGVSAKGVKVPVGGTLCRVGSLAGVPLGGGGNGVELGKAAVDVVLGPCPVAVDVTLARSRPSAAGSDGPGTSVARRSPPQAARPASDKATSISLSKAFFRISDPPYGATHVDSV